MPPELLQQDRESLMRTSNAVNTTSASIVLVKNTVSPGRPWVVGSQTREGDPLERERKRGNQRSLEGPAKLTCCTPSKFDWKARPRRCVAWGSVRRGASTTRRPGQATNGYKKKKRKTRTTLLAHDAASVSWICCKGSQRSHELHWIHLCVLVPLVHLQMGG
jgi:hypothetical protein